MLNNIKNLKIKYLPSNYKEKIEEELYLIGVDRDEFEYYFEKSTLELLEEFEVINLLNIN